MTTDRIEFRQPTPAEFRSIRLAIYRNRHPRASIDEANAAADLELELWLADQDQAKAAALLDRVAA